MGTETVINNLLATPHRVYAAAALLRDLGNCPRQELLALLQPPSLNAKQYSDVITSLLHHGLAQEDDSRQKILTPTPAATVLNDLDAFRGYMQQRLLGVTSDDEDNFVLNLFSAWYAVHDAQILTMPKRDYEVSFHAQLFPAQPQRPISTDVGVNAWQLWAEFLGWGWTQSISNVRQIVPDATLRVRPHLPALLTDTPIPFGHFIRKLGERCPELDGGVLFQRAWHAAHGEEVRGNRASLMLSTALRVLQRQGALTLIDRADAAEQWMLFPAQSYITRVTHIARKAPA